MRAVTFQSMVRTSSPGTYSRTSRNSMPVPLKTEWYSPLKTSSTRRRVRISILRTAARTSGGMVVPARLRVMTGYGTSMLSSRTDTMSSLVRFSASAS